MLNPPLGDRVAAQTAKRNRGLALAEAAGCDVAAFLDTDEIVAADELRGAWEGFVASGSQAALLRLRTNIREPTLCVEGFDPTADILLFQRIQGRRIDLSLPQSDALATCPLTPSAYSRAPPRYGTCRRPWRSCTTSRGCGSTLGER